MRGQTIVEPMTLAELAKACDLSRTQVRRYVADGHVQVDGSKRPMMAIGGCVPITQGEWRDRIVNSVGQDRWHMIGFEADDLLLVLDGCKIVEVKYTGSLDTLARQLETIGRILNRDPVAA